MVGRCIKSNDGILCWVAEDSEDEGPPSSSRTSLSCIDLTATQLKERVNIIPKTGHFKFSPSLVQYRDDY